jgi:eukaryotic-like serine/threonine-protein kinase
MGGGEAVAVAGNEARRGAVKAERWDQVKRICFEALERDAAGRGRFLDETCAGDPLLRKEIESLLAQQSAADDFIESPAIEAAARELAGDMAREPSPDFAGRSLLHYRIEEKVGEGGMGVVYRARDTRLDRDVAIKVLAPDMAGDRKFRERFDREAKVISRLDHPNICALHDVGEHEGVHFLVMQYLDGKTLAAHLKRGPLPLDRALRHAIEIAEALAMAHRHGIVHRDLKPGNIMLTKMGAKLLDFGLAKTSPVTGAAAVSILPAPEAPITAEGTVLGTIQYMAPEQLKGAEADARTDIFAFGAVLYEMLTGKRAFEGTSQASVITAIISSEPPPVSARLPMTPPALDQLVRHCLAKDPDDRVQNLHDVALELRGLADFVPVVISGKSNRLLVWGGYALAALAVAAFIITFSWRGSHQAVPQPAAVHFLLPPPPGHTFGDRVAVSPDGSKLAAVVFDASYTSRLWVRSLPSPTDEKILPDTDGAGAPFWSADSKSIGFRAGLKLKILSVPEGSSRTLTDVTVRFAGGTWNAEGNILFTPNWFGALNWVPAQGGSSQAVTRVGQEDRWGHMWPRFLADGRHFLFQSRNRTDNESSVNIGSLDSMDTRVLIPDASAPDFAPPDYLLFVRAGSLMAQRFDFARARPLAEPARVAELVPAAGRTGTAYSFRANFSVSGNGLLVYGSSAPVGTTRLVWRGRDGRQLGSPSETGPYHQVYLSPNEKQASVIHNLNDVRNLWLLPFDTNILSPITNESDIMLDPIWSPNFPKLVYQIYLGNKTRMMMLTLGERFPKVLLDDGRANFPDDWSPDGKWILGRRLVGRTFSIILIAVDGSAPPQVLRETTHNVDGFQFSPDGRWAAHNSDESGQPEVWVARFPSIADERRISNGSGCQPIWRKDGKELFYLTLDGKVMSVPLVIGAALKTEAPKMLFQSGVPVNSVLNQYAVGANGQRFLLVERAEDPLEAREPLHVVSNWQAALRR